MDRMAEKDGEGMANVKDILEKYQKRIESQVKSYEEVKPDDIFSREYLIFRNEALSGAVSWYEKLCKFSTNVVKLMPKKGDVENLKRSADVAHLDVTPLEAASFAGLTAITFILLGLVLGFIIFFFATSQGDAANNIAGYSIGFFRGDGTLKPVTGPLMLFLLFVILGFVLMKTLGKYPITLARRWRLKAGNQVVLCILYVVMYMRHTSNLEHAIKFAGEHIGNPLASDLRKIFWDVEVGRYSTIKESLDRYLESWKAYNLEFVESFHLIESSLYEPVEELRISRLDKALDVVLEGTYERMLHFAHSLQSPITILHMLGVILPILGLIILPLVGTMLGVKWWHIGILYNITLPIAVYYFGNSILSNRPLGYGERNIAEENPEFKRYRYVSFLSYDIHPIVPAILIGIGLCFIGFIPLIMHGLYPDADFSLGALGRFLDYKTSEGKIYGPFGVGAALVGFFVPLGLAIGTGFYYRLSTRRLISIREQTKNLEIEFSGSLFQLGNRIGEGIPSEVAFGKVAENLKGTPTGDFFRRVDYNIRRLGMDINEAIFNEKKGAILSYPSALIESSMKVLVETSRKGPEVVAKAMISISTYVDRLHKVNERVKDLLADITSSMKGQISFLAPLIAGIVVGMGSLITMLIGKLPFEKLEAAQLEDVPLNIQTMMNLFPTESLMPPYFFQLVIGLYVVEIVIILTLLANAIENGADRLGAQHSLGKNLYRSIGFFVLVAVVITVIFAMLANLIGEVVFA